MAYVDALYSSPGSLNICMNPHVHRFVGLSGWSVCQKGLKVTLPSSYRSTCFPVVAVVGGVGLQQGELVGCRRRRRGRLGEHAQMCCPQLSPPPQDLLCRPTIFFDQLYTFLDEIVRMIDDREYIIFHEYHYIRISVLTDPIKYLKIFPC